MLNLKLIAMCLYRDYGSVESAVCTVQLYNELFGLPAASEAGWSAGDTAAGRARARDGWAGAQAVGAGEQLT